MPSLNIGSKSSDWRAQKLSNFSADAFELDGEKFASVEGFIQGIKFPENHPLRSVIFQSVGIHAKRFGKKAQHTFVCWKGKFISFGSAEHRELIEKAICAKFRQNESAMQALAATDGFTLTHDLGHPESPHTSLPAKVFCAILTSLRKEAKSRHAKITCVIKKVEPGSYSSGAWVTVDIKKVSRNLKELKDKKDVRIFAPSDIQEQFWNNIGKNFSGTIESYVGHNGDILYRFV